MMKMAAAIFQGFLMMGLLQEGSPLAFGNLPDVVPSKTRSASNLPKNLPGAVPSRKHPASNLLKNLPGAFPSGKRPASNLPKNLSGAVPSRKHPTSNLPKNLPGAVPSGKRPALNLLKNLAGAVPSGKRPASNLLKNLPGIFPSKKRPGSNSLGSDSILLPGGFRLPLGAAPVQRRSPTKVPISGSSTNVFVDSVHGSNNNACESPLSPCKDLAVGIRKLAKSGTLHITGTHFLPETISLAQSVTLRSYKTEAGVIKGNGSLSFAFKVVRNLREDISIRMYAIQFNTIGVLFMHDLKRSATIELENITVRNTRNLPAWPSPKFNEASTLWFSWRSGISSSSRSPYYLTIKKSEFQNFSPLRLLFVTNVSIHNSTFHNDISSTREEKTSSRCLEIMEVGSVTLEGTRFTGCTHNKSGGAISITNQLVAPGFLFYRSAKKVMIARCAFLSCVSGNSGGAVHLKSVKTVVITQSSFTQCRATTGGAVSVVGSTVEDLKNEKQVSAYVSRTEKSKQQPDTAERSIISNCRFVKNTARIGGGVYIRNDIRSRISNVVFDNNRAAAYGQAIYSTAILELDKVTTTSSTNTSVNQFQMEGKQVSLRDVDIKTTNRGLLQSNMLINGITISSKKISIKGQLDFVCPVHFRSRVERSYYISTQLGITRKRETLLSVSCETCSPDTYTLSSGKLNVRPEDFWKDLNISESNGLCLKCPSGGICRGDVKPLDNYWGYLASDSKVEFTQCPPAYCCSSQTTPCTSFNTCNIGRRGALCGSCDVGYSQSFISNGCVKKDGISCNVYTFIGYFIAVSFFYTTMLTFSPSMIDIVKSAVAKEPEGETKQESNEMVMVEDDNDCAEKSQENRAALNEELEDTKENDDTDTMAIVIQPSQSNGPPPMSAYITLIAFFFQVASLVHVKIQQRQQSNGINKNSTSQDTEFQKVLFDLFNFRISVSQKLCPTDDLTLPVKELINVALKISSISNLVLFYLVGRSVSLIKSCFGVNRPKEEVLTMDLDLNSAMIKTNDNECDKPIMQSVPKDQEPTTSTKLSFNSILKIGFIKLVKLNFTSITTFCFHMISCVKIGENFHLYLYGDLQCYVWWQMIILSSVLPLVLVFPASFGALLNLLKDGFISTNEFLIASVLPPYMLYLLLKKQVGWLKKHCPTEEEKRCMYAILDMEEELFKTADRSWLWGVIQLYRNVLIVILNVFVLNPIYRCILFILIFGAFALHDGHRQPYKHSFLNYLQLLSSCCLLVISACNIPAAFSMTLDVMSVPYMKDVTVVLQGTELAMYILVPCSLPLWMVATKFQTRRNKNHLRSVDCE